MGIENIHVQVWIEVFGLGYILVKVVVGEFGLRSESFESLRLRLEL